MRQPPSGHMVINMKTTITTHGAHNGVIVHAGVQSGPGSSSQNQAQQWYMPSQFPQIETPADSRMHAVGPGTSQENITTNWPALQISTATSPQPHPEQSRLQSRQERSPQVLARMPSPSHSPVYSFTGRDSPPDEFIQPSRVTLNVFNPGRPDPVSIETSLRRTNSETADALINDTVTTTTTVEVFRTPLDPAHPSRVVTLPPAPVPSIDDRPQLLRVNGPAYEKWTGQRTETLINDRPVNSHTQHGKAVQWKETLVDDNLVGGKKVTLYDPYSGPRSPFANAVTTPHPPVAHQYQLPTVNSFDERLLQRVSPNRTSYVVQSPSTEFSQVSHPVITSSQEDLSRPPFPKSPVPPAPTNVYRELVSHPAVPDTTLDYRNPPGETPVMRSSSYAGYEQVRRQPTLPPPPAQSYPDPHIPRGQTSPLYVEPNRARSSKLAETSTDDRYYQGEPDRYRPTRRSHSSHRRRRGRERVDEQRQRHRSESPANRQHYASPGVTVSPGSYYEPPDPNRLPGEGPSRANSREIFRLYQTRDILQNVVAQFDALGYGFSDGLTLSPLAESEDSIISELSARADRTRSDVLVTNDQKSNEEAKPRPLHRTSRATSSEDIYDELDHIYEELDNYRSKSIVTPEASDGSTTMREEDTSGTDTDAGHVPINDVIVELKTPEVDRAEPEQQLQRAELTSSEYKPRVRKAHPDGLVFPRITATVLTLPKLPEEGEVSPLPSDFDNQADTSSTFDLPFVDDSPRLAVERQKSAAEQPELAVEQPRSSVEHLQLSIEHVMPADLTSTVEQSKRAELKSQAQVVADRHKLVIHNWESLISDSEEGG